LGIEASQNALPLATHWLAGWKGFGGRIELIQISKPTQLLILWRMSIKQLVIIWSPDLTDESAGVLPSWLTAFESDFTQKTVPEQYQTLVWNLRNSRLRIACVRGCLIAMLMAHYSNSSEF